MAHGLRLGMPGDGGHPVRSGTMEVPMYIGGGLLTLLLIIVLLIVIF